jgi:hypothetical protein
MAVGGVTHVTGVFPVDKVHFVRVFEGVRIAETAHISILQEKRRLGVTVSCMKLASEVFSPWTKFIL